MVKLQHYIGLVVVLLLTLLICQSDVKEGFENNYNDIFKNVWSNSERNDTLELLQFFDGFCKRHDIKYFTMYGTLIGQIRHGGFIPWDDDVDVGIMQCDSKKLVDNFASSKFSLYKVGDGFYKVFFSAKNKIGRHKWSWPFLDIFVFDRVSNGKITKTSKLIDNDASHLACRYDDQAHKYKYTDIFPLKNNKFENISLPTPHNPHQLLTSLYGSDWNDVCDSGNYNHKLESPKKTHVRIKCREALMYV
jgi:phosphorylcholine metabolism protein LicD